MPEIITEPKETSIKLGIGIFILVALLGTAFIIPEGYDAYQCNDNDQTIVGLCFKLSAVNSDGLQTRCYYNESAPRTYKNCKTGWIKYDEKIVVGNETKIPTYIEYTEKSLRKDFVKKIDAEEYIIDLKKEVKSNVTILRTEQRPFSDEIEVFWNALIYTEGYEEIDNGTIITREVLSNETLSSKFSEDSTEEQINETISKHAEEYLNRWNPNIIISS